MIAPTVQERIRPDNVDTNCIDLSIYVVFQCFPCCICAKVAHSNKPDRHSSFPFTDPILFVRGRAARWRASPWARDKAQRLNGSWTSPPRTGSSTHGPVTDMDGSCFIGGRVHVSRSGSCPQVTGGIRPPKSTHLTGPSKRNGGGPGGVGYVTNLVPFVWSMPAVWTVRTRSRFFCCGGAKRWTISCLVQSVR